VGFTGDADTVAAIALVAGSRSAEMEQNLPPALLAELENETFRRDYLMSLDKQLAQKFLLPKK
jgi:ADP-ribosylglycohydrolase